VVQSHSNRTFKFKGEDMNEYLLNKTQIEVVISEARWRKNTPLFDLYQKVILDPSFHESIHRMCLDYFYNYSVYHRNKASNALRLAALSPTCEKRFVCVIIRSLINMGMSQEYIKEMIRKMPNDLKKYVKENLFPQSNSPS